ncbi:ATP-binding protein [Arcobacter sp. F155]|uniref:sensor histidine kinase n=1 Tax=Arcobacter sp. F155 TaxID=2044512 RepID=UPI00100A447D|nr:HAMP domain-containing sensor histidine kinase [Arcobacter sp. F155]RXJ75690.1 ATP-binding protein [Arcobacter sp. F155]
MIDKLNTTRDLVIVLILGLILWLILGSYDGFEALISYLKSHEEYELDEVFLLLLILSPFLIVYALLRIKEAYHLNKELKQLNEKLEQRVQEELAKRKTNEALLIQQSRSAALGEMISNIAHQWRQPLNAVSLNVQNLDFLYKNKQLTDEQMERSVKKITFLTLNMSQTIDDFRNFFKPEKIKHSFDINETVKKALRIIDASFNNLNIKIDFKAHDNENIAYGYENEYSQVIVNILTNSKDSFIEKDIENPLIKIELIKDENSIDLILKDNAGGIPKEIFPKIFDPYFSTKENGTGIGLYMSKMIIEKSMNGNLSAKDIDGGVKFTISVPISKEK